MNYSNCQQIYCYSKELLWIARCNGMVLNESGIFLTDLPLEGSIFQRVGASTEKAIVVFRMDHTQIINFPIVALDA